METYKVRPVYVDAVQITDEMLDAAPPSDLHVPGVMYDPIQRTAHLYVNGAMGVVGYWIVRGEDGFLTVWADALFKATYEREKT
jgi:hypothetical protein